MATISNLPISQSLLLKGLSLPNKMAMVYSQDYGYNVLTQLTSKLASSISSPQARVEISSLGNLGVYSKIVANGTVVTGTSLMSVTVQDASKFRVGDIIADGNLVQALVTDVDFSGNKIFIAPHTTASLTAGTHFLANTQAKRFFDASANRSSVGKTTLNYTPDTDFALTAVTRESSHQSRRDRIASFVKWNGDFWWRSYDDLTLKAFAKQLEYKYAFSERAIKQGPNGEYFTTGGLRWSIINNGGSYLSLTSELTQSVFNDFLEQMVRVSAEGGRKLVALMGSAAMARLQTILGDYIKFAGTANTLGGASVTGLNVMKYAYAGLEIEFVRWSLLDDEMFRGELSSINGKPRMSNAIYFIDLTPIPAADGSGTIAALQKYHFNQDELLANYVPGMIGLESSDPSTIKAALSGGQSVSLGTSDVDGVDFHILSDCGLYCVADKMGLIEFAI
jgi:hypothetical protein